LSRIGFIGTGHRLRAFLVGEAPGETEDSTGTPFIGPSGRILNLILGRLTTPVKYCLTNVVNCRPENNEEPTSKEIELCSPKIKELALHFNPHCVVHIGKVAQSFKTSLPAHLMLHPAAIARMEYPLYSVKEQALLLNRFFNAIANSRRK
jgi:uracil-DNA glycosylase family 4